MKPSPSPSVENKAISTSSLLRFNVFKRHIRRMVMCAETGGVQAASSDPSADCAASVRDAVALILCPRGTDDMDECKLLTWCCLLCSLIKVSVALLPHNLPPNMLPVSATETAPLRFHASCLPYFPLQWLLIHENKTVIFDFARPVFDLPLSKELVDNRQRRQRAKMKCKANLA